MSRAVWAALPPGAGGERWCSARALGFLPAGGLFTRHGVDVIRVSARARPISCARLEIREMERPRERLRDRRAGRPCPFDLTPERVRLICAPHSGLGSDGLLLLSPARSRGFVARLQIFNPDGSEAELSGNGAREAIMYLRRRGWTESDTFSIETEAGEIRPTIPRRARAPSTWAAKLVGNRTLTSDDREFAYQHITVGNPQTAVEVEDLDFDLRATAPIEVEHRAVPEPDERVLLAPRRRPRDHRAHLRARRGGDDVVRDGRERCRRRGGAEGRGQPVTVHLDGGIRGRGGRGPACQPERMGRARLQRRAVRGLRQGAE